MAAPKRTLQDSESDSSSEDLDRFREAAWEPPGTKSVQCPQNVVAPALPSLRVQVDCHEHDGNELQTTPEFRSHIAKKLTAILDSCIKEIPASNTIDSTKSKRANDTEDGGFRLFCTSLPGDKGIILPSSSSRRKVASSSSEDSEEEERRCREAAVSATDILRNSALPQPHVVITGNEQNQKKKLKKKKKRHVSQEDEPTIKENAVEAESESKGLCVRRKKKKKQKVDNGTL
ncbi:protein CUSTOS [Pelodytes ibericus]